jgi:hypothetical protein
LSFTEQKYSVFFSCCFTTTTKVTWDNQGPMLWFYKYFRQKNRRKNWRLWLKTKL